MQVYGVCCHPSQQVNHTVKWEKIDDELINENITTTPVDLFNDKTFNDTAFNDTTSRIVNGVSSYSGEFPFMVYNDQFALVIIVACTISVSSSLCVYNN